MWLSSRAPEFEEDDPPAPCKLTDLSLGGCYLETGSPFPVRTRLILSMQVAGAQIRADGVVLVMHPELGMGVEFTQTTEQQREHVEKFIQALTNTNGALPELLVAPEGLDTGEPLSAVKTAGAANDPLLELFRKKGNFTPEAFQIELRQQRSPSPKAAADKASI